MNAACSEALTIKRFSDTPMGIEWLRRRYNQENMEVVQGQHRVYRLSRRAVWVCKYRRRVLKSGVTDYIKQVIA